MAIGKIIQLAPIEKGYGFIVSKEFPCERIYFHWSNLIQSTLRFPKLQKGMTVEFIPNNHEVRGMQAFRVKVVTDEPTNRTD